MTLTSRQKGIMFLVLSSFSFSVMGLFVKLSGDLPAIQKALFRNSFAAVVALFLLLRSGSGFKFDKKNLPFFILRTLFGTMGIVGGYYSIQHLVLADSAILAKLAPFFAIIFSFIFLKEKIKPYQVIAIFIAFAASLLIIKPSFGSSTHLVAALVGTAAGMMAGAAYTCVRYLSLKKESTPFIVFFFSFFSGLILLPFVIMYYEPMTTKQLIFLLGAGLTAAIAQFSLTTAYSYAAARSISVFDYSQIVFSAMFGLIIFGSFPDTLSIIGIAIIFAVALFMFLHKDKNTDEKLNS